MDLYGGGASIAQANAHTQLARDLNRQTYDFNKSLAEQLDNSLAEQDEDLKGAVQNDIISAGTAGGKLAQLGVAKATGGKAVKTALGTIEKPTTLAERLAVETSARESGEAISTTTDLARAATRATAASAEAARTASLGGSVEVGSRLVAPEKAFVRGASELVPQGETAVRALGLLNVEVPRKGILEAGEQFTGATEGGAREGLEQTGKGLFRKKVTTQVERQAAEKTAEREGMSVAEKAAAENADRGAEAAKVAKTALEGGSAAARKELEEKTAGKLAGKIGLKTVGKAAIAGAGGALDVYDDIQRFSTGGLNADTFGSNNWQRGGNIGNIIGSTLEVAGAFGLAVPGFGWIAGGALEGLGAAISVGSSLVEGYGDVKEAEDKKEEVKEDVVSQRRGGVVAQEQETVTARSE